MDTKKNMSREQLLAYMRDNCTEAEAQQVRMWLRERLKDPGLDQLFSDLLDATETEYEFPPPAAVTSGGGGGPSV